MHMSNPATRKDPNSALECLPRRRSLPLPLLLTAWLLLSLPSASFGEPDASYEDLDDIAVESVLPPKFLHSAHYAIEPTVRAESNFYHFTVTSDRTTYKVTSLPMLRQRLFEIATIAEVEPKLKPNQASFDRSPGGRRGVESEYVVDILSDPIRTAATLLGNIEYNVEQTLNPSELPADNRVAENATVDLNPGAHKRTGASQLGVDVYSTNPHLQRLLNAVADARSSGKSASSFSPLIRNPYETRPFGSGVLNTQLNSRIKNTASQQLHEEIDLEMSAMKVSAQTRIAFLTNPAFSPRTRLYFTTYASLLGPLRNLDLLFVAASAAATDTDALAYVNYIRMLAHAQVHHGHLTEVITSSRYPTVAAGKDSAVLALPLDYLAWNQTVAEAADALGKLRAARGIKGFVVLLAGTPTERTRKELAQRGVEIHAAYSF